jgi:hypothetical protein
VLLINILVIAILAVSGGLAIFRAFRGETAWSDLGPVGWGFLLFVVWFVVTIIVGVFGAIMVLLGKPFKYPFIGDWFLKRTT